MKNLLRSFVILFFITSLSFSANAQFIKKIQNAANRGVENAVQKRVEQEANKMTEKQLEKVFSDIYGDDTLNTSGGSFDMSKVMAGMGEPVDTEDSYDFFGYVVMEMTSEDEKGKAQEPIQMKSYLGKSTDYSAMEIADPKNPKTVTTMVFDIKNSASVILLDNEGEKMSIATKLAMDNINEISEEQIDKTIDENNTTLEKTGKTKNILGYACDEYHIKNEDGEGYYWVTEESIAGYSSFWGANNPMVSSEVKSKYAEKFKNLPTGNFLELTYTSSDGKVDMKVIEIEESAPQSFQMTDYPNVMQSISQQ